jgi:hypothetical protein
MYVPSPLPSDNLADFQAYIGIAGGFTFPIVFFVFFDLYYKAYWLYQLWLAGAAWNWGVSSEDKDHGYHGSMADSSSSSWQSK